MEQFILNTLSGYGLAGVVIIALGWTVLQQMKVVAKIHEARLAERDVLIKAIENNTQAAREHAAAIINRNEVTEELSKSIDRQAVVFELFMQKADLHDEGFTEKFRDFKLVIDSFSDAMRQNTSIVREVREKLDPITRRR